MSTVLTTSLSTAFRQTAEYRDLKAERDGTFYGMSSRSDRWHSALLEIDRFIEARRCQFLADHGLPWHVRHKDVPVPDAPYFASETEGRAYLDSFPGEWGDRVRAVSSLAFTPSMAARRAVIRDDLRATTSGPASLHLGEAA